MRQQSNRAAEQQLNKGNNLFLKKTSALLRYYFTALLFCCSTALLLYSSAETSEKQSLIHPEPASLMESRLDHGLTNNDAYSYILIEKSRASSERKTLLEQAIMNSPDLPAPYFKIASDRLDLSLKGIFEALDYIRKGIRAYERNFLWRFNLWGLIVRSFIISFTLSLFVMSIIRFPSEAGLIMHEINEDRKKAFLLAFPLIFSVFGLLPFLASMVILYGLYLRGKERIALYIFFFIIFVLSLSPGIWGIFSNPSYLKAVVDVNEGRDNRYALLRLNGRNDMASSFAYALALKREGYYRESIERYKKLAERYKIPEIYINLGNAFYASGDHEGAIEYYNKSLAIRPLAAAYYNLSQVYREMLDFKKGEEYFDEAARLDPESLRRYTSISTRNPNRFVVDMKLPDSLLWNQILSERGGMIRFTSVTVVTVIAILSFFIIDRGLKNRAKRCRRCGSIYCNRCFRMITWKDMCSRCYQSIVRIDQMHSKERIANLLLLYQSRAKKRMVARILSFILPGASEMYSGRILEGFLLNWAFFFVLTTIILSRVMTEGIYPFYHDWLLIPLLFLVIVLYVFSIIHIRKGIQKGWL
ncbi:MAG: tetratricopeptide repeat protein [Thermodesulfovibrionales bacterium]